VHIGVLNRAAGIENPARNGPPFSIQLIVSSHFLISTIKYSRKLPNEIPNRIVQAEETTSLFSLLQESSQSG